MANTTTATCLPLFPSLEMAWRDVDSSFERFCLTAGIGAVEQCCARTTRSSLPARRTVAAEAASATAGPRRRARSADRRWTPGRAVVPSTSSRHACAGVGKEEKPSWLNRDANIT